MATALHSIRITTNRFPSRLVAHSCIVRSLRRRRCFNSSSWRESRLDRESNAGDSRDLTEDPSQCTSTSVRSPKDLSDSFKEIIRTYGRVHQNIPEEIRRAPPFREPETRKPKPGALNMGMEPSEEPEDDPEFEEDDITSLAHGQLEQHREFRHYARLAAWEMPLLTKMAKPFEPPTEKQVLRFRYTNYMGEQHPAEKKVVVEFCPADMPGLTHIQREKLKKLAGSRWNPETDIIKMSCEMFETQGQNKRYLGDLVDTLLQEARDPTDTFEDIPLDTRHYSIKVKPRFPVEWRMTAGRRAELEASRQRSELIDHQKELQGAIVDGVQRIQAVIARPAEVTEEAMEPLRVMGGKAASKSKKMRKR